MLDSRKGAGLMCLDIKDHVLEAPMSTPEQMRVKIKRMQTDIRIKHNIDNLATSRGWMHAKFQKGIPGLK